MYIHPTGAIEKRRVRDGKIVVRSILHYSPEFAELDGQCVEIIDHGVVGQGVAVFGPVANFTAVPWTAETDESRLEYRARHAAWIARRQEFVAAARRRINDDYDAHASFMRRMWGSAVAIPARYAFTPQRLLAEPRLRPGGTSGAKSLEGAD